MVSDIHHIVPTDGKVNGNRSNFPFGKVGSANFVSANGSKRGTSASPNYSVFLHGNSFNSLLIVSL